MLESSRRGFLSGLVALVAAPAIVKATSLMPIRGVSLADYAEQILEPQLCGNRNSIFTIEAITREAIRLFNNSNQFLVNMDAQYEKEFAVRDAVIGSQLRIRLPNDYPVASPAVPAAVALAIAAPAILATPVTRRFWNPAPVTALSSVDNPRRLT